MKILMEKEFRHWPTNKYFPNTELSCDLCKKQVKLVAEIPSSGWAISVCKECLENALTMLKDKEEK